jgi:hypothetical protein
VLQEIFGQQEYLQELERRNTATSWLTLIAEKLSVFDAADISSIRLKPVPNRRCDYSLGVDYESPLFFTMSYSENDVEWLHFDDIFKLSAVQMEHQVPREPRLTLPRDIENCQNPFFPGQVRTVNMTPPYSDAIDFLPHPENVS